MTTIFLVETSTDYEGSTIEGIYSTLELAQKAFKEIKRELDEDEWCGIDHLELSNLILDQRISRDVLYSGANTLQIIDKLKT